MGTLWPEQNGKLCLRRIASIEPRREKGGVVFSAELARRYGDRGIVSTSLHPGIIKTDLFRHENYIHRVLGVRYSPLQLGSVLNGL
jgi:hypothetical protein